MPKNAIAKMYGIGDTTVGKKCRKLSIMSPKKGIFLTTTWIKKHLEKKGLTQKKVDKLIESGFGRIG
jgi:hypothetical protein